jgi:hypothetical protein
MKIDGRVGFVARWACRACDGDVFSNRIRIINVFELYGLSTLAIGANKKFFCVTRRVTTPQKPQKQLYTQDTIQI